MAEQIPFAVTSNLIHRLASSDLIEFGEQYDVKEEFEKLKKTIESINDVLLDADHKQEQVRVRNWIMHFKEVLHRADDLLDDLAIEFMRHKLDAGHGKQVNKALYSYSSSNRTNFPIQMAEEIRETRESFDAVVEDMYKLNLCPRSIVVKQTDSGWRETCSYVLETDIIGRDETKKEIISLLKQPHENQEVSVVAIVGLGGLGKTALAQLVYNDLEVQNSFEMQMWVCVSDNFDVKNILKKILESITDSQRQDQSLEKLQRELHKNLSGKKYLLVLDDIWNERRDKWAELRKYLMCGAQDSKILVTTRSENVAKTMSCSTSYPLRGLTDEASWSLLKNIAFEDDSKGVNQNLESTGKEIAKKCKGVPLAVKALGGLLQGQNEQSEWEKVLRGDFWKLCEEQTSIMPILKLSYENLSPKMRQCFAYCSLYPKDSRISKNELIQLWMAQGYLICSTKEEHMEDIEAKSDKYGEITSFKMHDLMHDLAILVAGNDCCYLDSKAAKVEGSPVHVSLKSSKAIRLLKSLDPTRLRTLILPYDFKAEKYQSVIAKFKYLRVLKIEKVWAFVLSDSTANLKHLRYLAIVGFRSVLENVVHISLFGFRNCRCLPPLEHLQSLKSLKIADLSELEYIDLDEDDSAVTFFPSLESLKLEWCSSLRGWRRRGDDINENSHNLPLPLSFPRLSQLHVSSCPKLTCMPTFHKVKDLEWCRSSAEPLIAALNTAASTCSDDSSSSAAPFSMLKQLTISHLTNFPKGWMQNLTSLESLQIGRHESETLKEFETEFKDDTNCLPSLLKISIQLCKIKALPNWVCNLSSLQHIRVSSCRNLSSLPERMSCLTNLKIFEVYRCPLLLKECRTETSTVSRQIAHIPRIILR
ncbi:putative disease resistance protein At3g14460 [Abrus precatorius]|uniref:Disease resistance protein At3g14460 n=1 Tax=Abrus precatorius TaxID=3816 RepID=A0A8B8JZW1_ABRPR|nr:putative disease resistance protein At3g14460 [Abrus precatorius]